VQTLQTGALFICHGPDERKREKKKTEREREKCRNFITLAPNTRQKKREREKGVKKKREKKNNIYEALVLSWHEMFRAKRSIFAERRKNSVTVIAFNRDA